MPDLNSESSGSEDEQNVTDVEMEEADSDQSDDEEMTGSDDENESEEQDDTKQEETEGIVHRNLYVQFPRKRPENAEEEIRKVSDKIKYVRLPRQKKARFCYVHCDTETDAIEVEKLLRTTEVCGFKLFVNRKRKIDDPEFRQKLKAKQIEKKIAKRDAKRLKKQLKSKAVKKVSKVNKIVVSNIPDTVTVEKLRQIFGTSVDFQYREKPNRIAFVTFSTAEEATKFVKKHPKVGERELAVRPMLIVNRKKKQFKRRGGNKGGKKDETPKEETSAESQKMEQKGVTRKQKERKTGNELKTATQNKFMKKQKGKSSHPGTKINYVALKKPLG